MTEWKRIRGKLHLLRQALCQPTEYEIVSARLQFFPESLER
jgi:hypothetical protein